MSELTPCPECHRHVRKSEQRCPFCGQGVSPSQLHARVLPRTRLGRAATFAFGASLASATTTTLTGCGGDAERRKEAHGGTASGGAASGASASGAAVSGGSASGGTDESSGGTDVITPVVPPYGAPPADTGEDAGGAGGIASVDALGGAPAAGSGVGGFIGIPK